MLKFAFDAVLSAWPLVQSFYTPQRVGHSCIVLRSPRFGEYLALCECGSRWTYAADSDDDKRRSGYESHLKFFDKPAATVL